MSKAQPIIQRLLDLGFVKDPQPKGYEDVYNLGRQNVSIQTTHGGLWIWLDNGIRIQRKYCRTDEEIAQIAQNILA